MMRRSLSARPLPGDPERRESPEKRGSPEKRNPLRMAARTAGLAAEDGVEAVVGEAVSVRKAASGKVRRAAHRQRRATNPMPFVPRVNSTRSRTAMDVLPPRPLRTMSGSSDRSAKANLPTPYR
jgi:hypothetical protein